MLSLVDVQSLIATGTSPLPELCGSPADRASHSDRTCCSGAVQRQAARWHRPVLSGFVRHPRRLCPALPGGRGDTGALSRPGAVTGSSHSRSPPPRCFPPSRPLCRAGHAGGSRRGRRGRGLGKPWPGCAVRCAACSQRRREACGRAAAGSRLGSYGSGKEQPGLPVVHGCVSVGDRRVPRNGEPEWSVCSSTWRGPSGRAPGG